MNFIRKIFENKIDEKAHNQFTKFGTGNFEYRALLEITNSKSVKIKTSPEFANELVELVAKELGSNSTKVTGAIISTRNLKEESIFSDILAHAEVKQFQGVKRFIIDTELTGEQILSFLEECPYSFFGLTFESKYSKLKIKPKSPKSGKPKKGESILKADFCTLTTKNKEILEDYTFDIKEDFKKAKIYHTFIIEDIIIPEEFKDDFAKARLNAKRKGKIIRKRIIDEKESSKETEFEA
jgi:hypothetical protein